MSSKHFSALILSLITLIAYGLGLKFQIIGPSMLALISGMVVTHSPLAQQLDLSYIKKLSSLLLKISIVLLGFTLSLRSFILLGGETLSMIILTVPLALVVAWFIGKKINATQNIRLLVGIGTAICGGSAIASAAPILDAEDEEIALSLSTIFFFNLLGLFIFPVIGHWLHLSDADFGLWAGTAINDTSSVVAAGFTYSEQAGEVATVVKLVRTLMIIPTCLSFIVFRLKNQPFKWQTIRKIIPTFIIWFIFAILIRATNLLPDVFIQWMKFGVKVMMTAALAGIGLTTHLRQLFQSATKPLLIGGLTWIILAAFCLLWVLFT
ncbi:putative sulfate exporter family transporter [Aerococcaceae bacterium zg-ZJ1578]|uniref:YeiH family protein n=1 Tax=Aerococcaceae bacterium zg-252 TaxID=2796928 RepID=UPI001A1F3E4E|nr:putative sulfate exporter family transporter [Aerococcaceae bacterium zg-1578]